MCRLTSQGALGGPAALFLYFSPKCFPYLISLGFPFLFHPSSHFHSTAPFLVPCCTLKSSQLTVSLLRLAHTHTHTHTGPRAETLTRLLGLGFARALGGLAPHGEPVLQQPQVPALLPPGGAHLHHVGALHHHAYVVTVQTWSTKHTDTHTQNTRERGLMCKVAVSISNDVTVMLSCGSQFKLSICSEPTCLPDQTNLLSSNN